MYDINVVRRDTCMNMRKKGETSMKVELTKGNIWKNLFCFSLPYLLSCFLQTFYGLADLFITGQFNGAATISAVAIGSQVMHMLTVIIVGLAMGSTVFIGRAVGAKKPEEVSRGIGNTVSLFLAVSVGITVLLLLCVNGILSLIATPREAFAQARSYLIICFAGVPVVTAYNVVSSIFRGKGDSKSPMYFVAAAGVINIFLDYLFIGPLKMGAAGAAFATVFAQLMSVLFAVLALKRKSTGVSLCRPDFVFHKSTITSILKVGIPIACQDGFVQVSFMVITAIANSRGVNVAASVGIVEKIISFLFLVPSAMLSSVSVIAAQNAGAGLHERGEQALRCAVTISVSFGILVTVCCEILAEPIVGLFTTEGEVVRLGSQYLRSYVFDCIAASGHFCFSGYFCAYGKSGLSFIQNLISIILVRIPGAYFASVLFPSTLLPMGMAAPAGSFLSTAICIIMFIMYRDVWNGKKAGAV